MQRQRTTLATEAPPAATDARATARVWTSFAFLPHLVAFILTLVALAVGDPRTGVALVAIVSCAFGVTVTIRRSESFLPPSSVFFLASSVFIGGGGYYLLIVDQPIPLALIRDAAGLAMLSTLGVAVYLTIDTIRRGTYWPPGENWSNPREIDQPPLTFLLCGIGLTVAALTPPALSAGGPLVEAGGVGGVLMIVVWAASRRFHVRWFGDALLLALVAGLPLLWINLTFSGYGRLTIAGLFVAAFMAWNVMSPSRVQKLIVILAIPFFLIYAGQTRQEQRGGTASNAGTVLSEGQGLASVYSPLQTYAEIIGPHDRRASEMLEPRWGETFVHTLVLPIPRSVWENKPKGFGAELTEVLRPKLAHTNHSMAALIQGEFHANFGYLGLPLLCVAAGFVLVRLDRWHARLARSSFVRDWDWWSLAALASITSSAAEFYWVGTFTWFARGGLASVAVLLTGLIANRRHGTAEVSEVGRAPRRRPRPLEDPG